MVANTTDLIKSIVAGGMDCSLRFSRYYMKIFPDTTDWLLLDCDD